MTKNLLRKAVHSSGPCTLEAVAISNLFSKRLATFENVWSLPVFLQFLDDYADFETEKVWNWPGAHSLEELRTIQDWFVKPRLLSVSGVTEVLGIGGHEKQYQVRVRPESLLRYAGYLSGVGLAADPPAVAAARPPPQRELDLVY